MIFPSPSPASRSPGPRRRAFGVLLGTLACLPALECSGTAQSLVNGGTVQGAITTSGGQDAFTFVAQAGESYVIRLVDSNQTAFFPRLTVLDPVGGTVSSDADGSVAQASGVADLTGTHQVVVQDANSTPVTGAYRIDFVLAPGANEGGALPNGGTVNGTVGRGDLDSYTFDASAGENFLLRLSDTNATSLFAQLLVYDPSGAFFASDADGRVASISRVANLTGTYTVVVLDANSSPSATGDYRVHFVRAPGANAGGALSSGGIVSADIGLGELDSYTFSIEAGQSYQLRASDTNATGLFIQLQLFDPRGCFVAADADGRVAALGGAAEFSGVYTVLVIDANSSPSATGDYNLHYVRAPGVAAGGTLPSGGSVTGSVGLGELDAFEFEIEAGHSYQLRANDTDGTSLFVRMLVYDPRGCFVVQDADATVAALGGVAAFTGRYTVFIVDGNSSPSATGAYELYFAEVPSANAGGPLRDGGALSGVLDRGEIESFTFSIEAGEGYSIRFADRLNTSMFPRLLLYDPRGEFVVQDSDSVVAALNGTAQFTGTYTALLLDGNSSPTATGMFDAHFVRAGSANEGGYLLDGVVADGVIDVGDLDSFTLLADAGDNVQITLTDTVAGALFPVLRVFDPNGQFVNITSGATTVMRNFVAALDGTYTLVVHDGNSTPSAIGPYSLLVTGSGRLGNSGCDREGAPVPSGAISASAGFSIAPPEFTRTCTSPSFVILGACAPSPLLLPNGLSCGTCGLAITNVFVSAIGNLVVPPLPASAVGESFCVQSLCAAGPCVTLSAATEFVVVD